MSISTKIQWCDSTCNPTMGCEGCELWTAKVKKCYAGMLHVRFGGATKGYSPTFEQLTYWPGRMKEAAGWSDLTGSQRQYKPWLDGMPRLIFVSDMSDALSAEVSFEYLEQEVLQNVTSPEGQRHHWLWLTKRPDRMAKFSEWLAAKGITWPENLWAGTSITSQATTSRIKHLLSVGNENTIRFLSVEPQWQPLDLSAWLPRLDWIIQGGESGRAATPFDLRWALDMIQQCQEHDVAYFLKQLGSHVVQEGRRLHFQDNHAGNWTEWPRAVQVRQMPDLQLPTPEITTVTPTAKTKTKAELSEIAKKAWRTRRRKAAERAAE